MDAGKEKILDKIKKLFRLGDANSGGTEAEIELAVTRAREMMARHNIAMAELDALGDSNEARAVRFNIRESTAYTRKIADFAPYDYYVVQAVNILTDTRCYVQHVRTPDANGRIGTYSRLIFLGDDTDVAVAIELFTILLQSVRRAARVRFGSDRWDTRHTSHALGFGARLISRAKEKVAGLNAQEQQCVALVLRDKNAAIDDYWGKLRLTEGKKRNTKIDNAAWMRGWHDGVNLSLEKDKVVR